MKTIGITCGVGSGNSAILEHFKQRYDARIIRADEAAHLLEEPGQPCYNKIVQAFGNEILQNQTPGAVSDKQKLATFLFQNPDALQKVNDIVHPEVKKYILAEIEKEKQEGRAYVVVEAALLLECGYLEILDEIWYIYAAVEIRRKRLKESRGYSDARIDGIMASQLTEDEYRRRCHHVIDNDRSIEEAKEQIDRLLEIEQ